MNSNHTIVTGAFVLLLIFLLNPFGLWTPDTLGYLMVGAIAVVAALFASLVTGEQARDEREEHIRAHSARAGYLAGVFILTLAIAITELQGGASNPWVVSALIVMLLVRSFVRKREE